MPPVSKSSIAAVFGDKRELVQYALAGVVNTLVGYGVFWGLLRWAGFSAELANAGGYVAGLAMAFTLNGLFVFAHAVFSAAAVLRFVFASLAAFLLNQVVLIAVYRGLAIAPEIAQLFGMVTYTLAFYLLNKHFVFKPQHQEHRP